MKKPIRILQVFHGMDCGGAETMIMSLYRKIDREKVQFDFLVHTSKECFYDSEIKSLGGRIFNLPKFKLINYSEYSKALNAFFDEHSEFSVVHGHLGSCAGIYLQVAKEHGCFTIAHSHNTKPNLSLKSIIYSCLTLKTRRVAEYFMACSKAAGEYRFGKDIVANENRFMVLNNAIDTEKYVFSEAKRTSFRKEFKISEETMVIGHIGRFSKQKNHMFLLDVFKEILNQDQNAVLVLVGDGELKERVTAKARRQGIDNRIIFTGIRNDVPAVLSGFDVFIFPSLYEGLGIAVVEAQAAGLFTICSDVLPIESKVTNIVKYIPLKEPIKVWANTIINNKSKIRLDQTDYIINAGYDINQTVNLLGTFYIEHYNKVK